MLGNERLEDLIYMFSFITGMENKEAKAFILSTETGKAVLNGVVSVLYEQHTSNMEEIIMELKKLNAPNDITQLFTIDNIYHAMQGLWDYDNKKRQSLPIKYEAIHNTSLNRKYKESIKNKSKIMLLGKKQDMINLWRMSRHANKIKR